MVFLVAYDDSRLARGALDRAVDFAAPNDVEVVAVTVIPRSRTYALENDWITEDEEFDPDTVEDSLRARVTDRHPDVTFHAIHVGSGPPNASIALKIRRFARQMDAGVVFLGSENAGRIVTNIVSVAQNVATDLEYDVHLVRHAPS